ncbi:DNA-binding transcriptional regulator, MarR family [Filimonas lacunae]|uniref:DNA-binding transcriptional regulator, MarR family n=1 Tax=Filimonas lacunae TaxID=477680 RepID=A0A173MNV8_9BACT|nr:MarR family transcriptional regulator [Filimonas lacunae]BAV09333.1 transcriptional regulator, MarR family [Filimonas lacunae]SIS71290.1 DNA-binding transcriptional regulator, MarR family [Filimonas lacunae]
MNINSAIQQPRFRNEYQRVMVNILYSSGWITDNQKKFLEPEDITPQQYNILRILRGSPKPLSTLQIRERMLDKMSDTSRIVDRLLAKGLVSKSKCTTDKRLVDILINEKGLELLERLDSRNHELDHMVASSLSEEEAMELNTLLDKMRSGVSV